MFTARYELDLYIYNSTFSPHSVFMCFFVNLRTNSDYIISLYHINGLVFVTEVTYLSSDLYDVTAKP